MLWPRLPPMCGHQPEPVDGTDGPILLAASVSLPLGRKYLLGGHPPHFVGRKLRHSVGAGLVGTEPSVLWAQCNTDRHFVGKSCSFIYQVFAICPEPSPRGAPGWGPEPDRHPYLTGMAGLRGREG